ncbi:MAG: tRNA threonylcarbamoyladenosine dehydratase [Oscillospiraceae bacterium]|nr:tRNA threonylcarbamoyladenosine dehydratase [Oscillospiraceae bacterium]MBQ9110435.1 tRNA threonylcarbamoyladenosine dehydratase [Oscillospiraceae bacterium]
MLNQFSRTELMFGSEGMAKLAAAHVAVFGIGGVGGHAVDALARSGVGALTLIDNDDVSLTNVNRQMVATLDTVGQPKVEVAQARIRSIHPECRVTALQKFFLPENAEEFDFTQYDYIVDAIDTVSGKIALAELAQKHHIPIISSMGAGNKLDPTAFRVADIYKTSVCPLAKVMRHELKKRGIRKLKVVYSEELPLQASPEAIAKVMEEEGSDSPKLRIPASNAFVPSVVGLIIAGEVIKDITGVRERKG